MEKRNSDSTFTAFNRYHVKFQVHANLTQIKVKNKNINLLIPLRKDYEILLGLINFPLLEETLGEGVIITGITGLVILFGFLFMVSIVAIILRPFNGQSKN